MNINMRGYWVWCVPYNLATPPSEMGGEKIKSKDQKDVHLSQRQILFVVWSGPHMRHAHGRLIAKLVCTSRVYGATGMMADWMRLDADAMVKPSVGTVLGGRSKDSILHITRI